MHCAWPDHIIITWNLVSWMIIAYLRGTKNVPTCSSSFPSPVIFPVLSFHLPCLFGVYFRMVLLPLRSYLANASFSVAAYLPSIFGLLRIWMFLSIFLLPRNPVIPPSTHVLVLNADVKEYWQEWHRRRLVQNIGGREVRTICDDWWHHRRFRCCVIHINWCVFFTVPYISTFMSCNNKSCNQMQNCLHFFNFRPYS